MEQFPSFSILENILQNILSFHVWCHRNLSQFPVTPFTVWLSWAQLLTQDPGLLMFDWNVYPGPGWGSVELLGNHKPRHGLHNPCGRGWLSRVSWHYWGSLDIRDNDNTHATLIWEEHVCDEIFHTREKKRGYYWEWDWADLAEMGHQYFFVYREYAAVIN